MRDRRNEARLLCADLVQLEWHDPFGKLRRSDANLEDISASGACLQLEHEIPLFTDIRLLLPKGELKGIVRYCIFRDIGYFLGVEFAPDTRWSPRMFRPMHLLDPRRLVHRVIERVTRPTT
jgi:hypothetical protein